MFCSVIQVEWCFRVGSMEAIREGVDELVLSEGAHAYFGSELGRIEK